jgi:hypothetical protein
VVHDGDFIHPNALLLSATTYIDAYRTAMEKDKVEGVMGETGDIQGPNAAVRSMETTTLRNLQTKLGRCLRSKEGKNGFRNYCAGRQDSNRKVHAAASYSVESRVWLLNHLQR